ncbi:MAG: hypothetical protein FJX77_00730 [Armatimonadetes bacterium]|nr:hypothetical protein [Armatimonadota bacterium]
MILREAANLPGFAGATGLVGDFSPASVDEGVSLLQQARAEFRRRGIRRLLGPMNGSTWDAYRCLLPDPDSSSSVPRFPGEPELNAHVATAFQAAGFRLCDRYESRLTRELSCRPGTRVRERLVRSGVEITRPDTLQFRQALPAIHALTLRAFATAPHFQPLPLPVFLARLQGEAPPEPGWSWLAYAPHGRLVGYVYSYPWDGWGQGVILKTMVVANEPAVRGLSAVLTDELHARAAEQGKQWVIHALMHENNGSASISQRYGTTRLRSYGLFEAFLPETDSP